MTQNDPARVRFGPFEADLRTHELWKFGTRLKLVGQPFEILAVLVSRPGELVTRDELRTKLWPAETFVDFNHGLNAAVNKLREALSDSADEPKYIETLPRRGYRFIGKLETTPDTPAPSVAVPKSPEVETAPPPTEAPTKTVPPPPRFRHAFRSFWTIGVLMGLVLVSSVLLKKIHSREMNVEYTPGGPAGTVKGWQLVVVSGKARYEGPQFSPDGKKLVFMSNRTGGMDLWTCEVDGSNLTQITTLGDAGTPRWSPDGKMIAFDSRVHNYGGTGSQKVGPEGLGAILVVDVSGGSQRFLVVGDSNNVVPSWSRDGQYVYFASDRTGSYQVWKAPLNGGAPVQITKSGGFAAWEAADGKYVYYSKNNQPNPEIWRVPSDGGEESLVSPAMRPGTWASWSVTSDGIYFVGSALNNAPTLSFYEFSTQRLHEYTTLDTFPFWFTTSNDGKRVAFAREIADGGSIVALENFR